MNEIEKFGTGVKFRDLLRKFIRAEVDRIRPKYRYATVVNPAVVDNKVEVQFPGETGTVMVVCPYDQPLSAGQVVRVEGLAGDRFIAAIGGGGKGSVLFAYDYMVVP